MSPDNSQSNSAAELLRGEESLRAAELLLREGLISDAVSRAYYAGFHAVRALLFTIGQEPRSHRGALHLFNLHFVRTQKLDPKHLAALARAQYDRTNADYGAADGLGADEAREEITAARDLIGAVRALITAG